MVLVPIFQSPNMDTPRNAITWNFIQLKVPYSFLWVKLVPSLGVWEEQRDKTPTLMTTLTIIINLTQKATQIY